MIKLSRNIQEKIADTDSRQDDIGMLQSRVYQTDIKVSPGIKVSLGETFRRKSA